MTFERISIGDDVTKFGLRSTRQNFSQDRLDWIRLKFSQSRFFPNMTKFWLESTWSNMATFGSGPDQSNFGQS